MSLNAINSLTVKSTSADALPKDAAAIILWRENSNGEREIFWARRNERLAFLGGFHAFPGGVREASDAQTEVRNCEDATRAVMIACAARELAEELGVRIARDDSSLDANDFGFVGRWVTPAFSPRRFDTWFFLVRCPPEEEEIERSESFDGELTAGEWIAPRRALERWKRAEVMLAPPVLHAVRTLADGWTDDLIARFLSVREAHGTPVRRIEFLPGLICFPQRTPTKPPATHTNCYVIGGRDLLVIDPASSDEEEQSALARLIDKLTAEGRRVREIVLTHHHPDHTGGVEALRWFLNVPVAAHRHTADALRGRIRVDHHFEDGDVLELAGEPAMNWQVLHTPGHARGHLCFYEERTGALITGDMVVGIGSILIDSIDGDMRDYLDSLERLKNLPNLRLLLGGHGPPSGAPRRKIEEYIRHRLEREAKILEAVREGIESPAEIVKTVYTDVHPSAHAMAERAVVAHLIKLEADNLVARRDNETYEAIKQARNN